MQLNNPQDFILEGDSFSDDSDDDEDEDENSDDDQDNQDNNQETEQKETNFYSTQECILPQISLKFKHATTTFNIHEIGHFEASDQEEEKKLRFKSNNRR
ncbi:UNKNOWN [Stylonychia lemnae]|uniref:Uncharacterized protein n=1 Tax=Stylonychia lemnae TaxID=5949 RepID=A0A077ZZ99_STYLE|nr:UNKNOWN [Stylonychia lemnae]|eukprot:CDW75255.1 UNKNOWN [Stylonychia lemnae]